MQVYEKDQGKKCKKIELEFENKRRKWYNVTKT